MNQQFLLQNKKTVMVGIIAFIALMFLIVKPGTSSLSENNISIHMNRHDQQIVQFFTKVIGSQNKTRVYIPFSFEGDPIDISLGYVTKKKTMKEFQLFHPQIATLNWSQIRENDMTLFQREPTYTSVAEFMKTYKGSVVIDPSLQGRNLPLKTIVIDNVTDLTKYDFVLSTQIPLKTAGNTFYYENNLDTSDADLDESGQITWVIRAPKADPNHVFFLGNIDITYLQ